MKKVDPITLATTWHYMQRVCREMREVTERTATNTLIVTLHDLAYGIWDSQARVIAIPEGFPCRLISSTYPIRAVARLFENQIYPGDVFLTNHPFKAGAVHLPDWVFVRPVFYKNELVFYTCMGTHVPDNGGAQAGTHFLANDSIAEGFNIPPVKLVERGQMREDVFELILSNNRMPDMMRHETVTLIGSTTFAEQRLVQLLDKYGKETIFTCIEEMINRTEKAVRAEISKWPDGTYYAQAQTDDDGAELDVPVTIKCKLTVKGDEATFDFSESDEQRKGYINAVYPVTLSTTLCTVFLFLGTELSFYHNEGSIKPVHVVTRPGTFVDCKPGSLTASTPAVTGGLIIECVMSALSQVLPHRAIAPYGRLDGPGMKVGIDPRNNELYVFSTFSDSGGGGAVYGFDGYQCCCDIGTLGVVSRSDAEDEMVRFPWEIINYEFLTDSPGHGKWRGAPGTFWEAKNEGADCVTIGGSKSGWKIPGQGQQGGYDTPLNKCVILRGNETIDIHNPHVIHNIKHDDRIVCRSGGGAGVGHPEERDTEAVRMDVKNEIISLKTALEIYKVALNPDTLEIDHQATKKLRAETGKK